MARSIARQADERAILVFCQNCSLDEHPKTSNRFGDTTHIHSPGVCPQCPIPSGRRGLDLASGPTTTSLKGWIYLLCCGMEMPQSILSRSEGYLRYMSQNNVTGGQDSTTVRPFPLPGERGKLGGGERRCTWAGAGTRDSTWAEAGGCTMAGKCAALCDSSTWGQVVQPSYKSLKHCQLTRGCKQKLGKVKAPFL